MNAPKTRIPSVRGSSRLAGSAAVITSALLHGALAATFFAFYSPPRPEAPGTAIVVELISFASDQGPGQVSDIDTATASGPAAVEEKKIAATEPAVPTPVSEAEQVKDVAREETAIPESVPLEPDLPEPTTEIIVSDEPPIAEAYDFPVARTAFVPAPPRPIHQPPAQFAAILPPPRPNAKVKPDLPVAPAESVGIIEETNTRKAVAVSAAEASSQIATRTDGDESEAPGLSGGGGDPGGLFVGPGFRLGTTHNPLPRYPLVARRRGWEGRVVLHVQVSVDGQPLSVLVAQSSRVDILDEAAVAALKNWRFEPARQAGFAVDAAVDVPITFRLRD